MKIIFLTRSYAPNVGGVEKHIAEIMKYLRKNHSITLITEQTENTQNLYETTSDIVIHRIPTVGVSERNKKWVIWKWLWDHRSLLDVDIIHIHDVFFWILPYRLLLKNTKIYMTFHGYEGWEKPGIKQIIWHRLAGLLTNGNITIGQFHEKWYGVKAQIISYGGVSARKPETTKRNGRAIFIGRLAPDTGIMDYIRASYLAKLPLDVYGDGPQLTEAVDYIKTHKCQVKLHGFVPDISTKISSYSYAFVSRYLGILECLISKTPVIAHYNNSIKHDYLSLAPFAPFIDIVTKSEDIVATLGKIRDNHVDVARIKEGYLWAKDQTWEQMASLYEQLWAIKSP